MSEIQDRCVVLKNIPFTCEERDVRETLDFAHGDFRFMGKYEKLHKHIEFGNDVRWIVLFMFKRDAIRCITDGSWVSNSVRGGCRVEPDYCSGCIIPDEWSKDKFEDEEWDMAGSVRTRDCDVDTSDDFMNSFVNVKHKKNLTYDDIENSENDGELGVANVKSVDLHREREKPIPAKRSTVKRKEFDEIGNETTRFQNQFESLITDFEGISSDDMFGSGNRVEHMHAVKVELDSYKQSFPNTLRSSESTCLSGERISTSELFGSGGVQPDRKEKEDITKDKDKEDISKSANERSSVFASKRDDGNSKERLYKRESGRTEEILSDELFGSGSIQYEEKEKKNTSTVRQKENGDTLVTERSLAKEKDQEEITSNEHETRDGVSDTMLKKYGKKMMSDSKNLTNYNNDDKVTKRNSSGDLFESSDRNENVNTQYSDDMLEPKTENGIDMKHIGNASVRSADLFGSIHESMENKNKKNLDEIDEANVEQPTGNAVNDTKSEADKLKISEEQAVETGSAAYSSGVGLTPPIYHSMPYSPYMMMYPNPQGASNMNYGQYMTMMPPSQNQPNATSPENNNSPACMNAMYQMPPYPWPMQMPVQGQEKGQQMYQYMPFPVMMPPMQVDEQGKPLQNPPGMMMQQGYFMPYLPGQHQFVRDPQQSPEEENNSFVSSNSDRNGANIKVKSTEVSKSTTNDHRDSSDDTKETIYDVPRSRPKTIARQTSTSKSSLPPDNTRVYSFARESKPDVVCGVDEQKYSSLLKNGDLEERIYDEIDESALKSIVDEHAPEPPLTRPPAKSNLIYKHIGKKEKTVPVYVDEEYCDNKTKNDEKESENSEESCRTILVTGLQEHVSKDTIELYFENKKISGGGEIISTTINAKKLQAVIEFKESKDAAAVIQRAKNGSIFKVVGCQLQVSEYHPPPMDPFRVFIDGIAESTSSECIENFLAAHAHLEAKSVVFGDTPGTALICFDTCIDKTKLRRACEARSCEGNYWTISEVELVRSVKVEVTNARTTTEESVCLYFENKRKSNGGHVESVQYREEHGDFIVTFENCKDAERVCTVDHVLNGENLKVSLFYPCLELDEEFIVRIPPAVKFHSIDVYIIKFLKNSKKYREVLERALLAHNARLHMEITPPTFIQIKCTVDPNEKNGYLKVKNWTENCTNILMENIEKLTVERSRNVAVEVWNEMKNRLQQINVSDPDSVALFLESNEFTVVMAGEKEVVKSLAAQINKIITSIEDDFENKKQVITQKRKLKHYEMALVRVSRLEATLKKILPDLSIDNEQREVVCKGMQKEVEEALAKLDAKLKSFVKKPVPEMTKEAMDLLFMREARDLVKRKMMEKKIIGVWDSRQSGLVMYSKNETDVDIAIEIMRASIKMGTITLDSEKKDILDGRDGKAKITELEENNKGCIIFTHLPYELRFVCVNELYKGVLDELSNLFDLHSLVSKPVQTEFGILEYIVKYNKKEVENIEKQFNRLAVEIETKESRRNPGFIVKGKKDGCKLAIAKLQSLIDLVVHKDYTVSWPGFDKFVKSNEGKDCIHTIERFQQCVIKVSSEDLSSRLESKSPMTPSSGEQKGSSKGIRKEVIIGTLATEKADVIVNSTNKDLDMTLGAISRSLLKAGGDVIRQECKAKYPEEIKPGRVAATTGGSLACEEIFHGLLVKWDGGQGHSENVLQTFVKSCLALAHTKRYRSIAFPALGTGALGFPADVVAKIMFDTVDYFEAKYPDSSLALVRFVVWSEDRVTARAFKDVEAKAYVSRPTSRLQNYRQSELAESLIVNSKGYSTTIGSVTVSIVQDDLTTLTSGAIVNSTTDDLNLNSGAISKAILMAAGPGIQNEALLQKEYFLRKGLVVTGPGKLMCRSIIHVRARNSLPTWTDTIQKCLIEAENRGLNSIAFPALGTGGKGVPPDKMARTMIETFQDYIKSSDFQNCLKTIRVVIFEQKMLDLFTTEAKSIMEPEKAPKRKGFLSELKFWENKPQIAEKVPRTTFHIYCRSQYSVDTIIQRVDDIRKEKNVFVKTKVLEHLDETNKLDLKRIGFANGVKVVVEKSQVKVLGYGSAIDTATRKIEEYIFGLERDIKKGYSATAVQLPKVWTKMKLSDPTKCVMLLPGDQDRIWVSQKFQNESGILSTRIVKIERIQNPTLFTQYIGKKTQMEMDNKGGRKVEQLLWHGTDCGAATIIKYKGFDRNYNSGASHGAGVYFAVNASTSANGYCKADAFGHKNIFLAHVLTGEFCVGQYGIKVPPSLPGNAPRNYDSTTDSVQNPNFFVIFHDAQAYPSYLITFK